MFNDLGKYRVNNILYFLFFLLTLNFPFFTTQEAAASTQASFTWALNQEPDLAGYRIFQRELNQPYDYSHPSWEGTATSGTIYNLDESKSYCFVARAFDIEGFESEDSEEACLEPSDISSQPPVANEPPTAIATPEYLETTQEAIVTLDGSASIDLDDGIASFLWTQIEGIPISFSDPSSAVTSFTVPVTDTFDKNIELRLTVTDQGGLKDTADCSISITPNESPTLNSVSIRGSSQVNESSETQYTLTAIYSDGDSNDVTGLASWSDNSSYADINNNGLLTASLVESNQSFAITASYEGLVDTFNVIIENIVSNNSPSADFGYSVDKKIISFFDSSTDGDREIVAWLWDFGDGIYDIEQNPKYRYKKFGNYLVTLTVTDSEGVRSSISKTVSIIR